MWRPSFLTTNADEALKGILAHKLIGHYASPVEFDIFNGGDLMSTYQSDKLSKATNLSELMYLFALKNWEIYKSNHFFFVFGDDFAHP